MKRPIESINPGRRGLVSIATALTAALLLAACGSGGQGSRAQSNTASKLPSGSPAENARVLRFTECVRSHGVPSVPDPGTRSWKAALGSSAPAVVAAERTCSRLVPGAMNSSSSSQPSHSQLAAEVDFARCMRDRGYQRFPDPSGSGGITHQMVASAGIDVQQPAVLRAADSCVGVTHGLLTRSTVARFAAGH